MITFLLLVGEVWLILSLFCKPKNSQGKGQINQRVVYFWKFNFLVLILDVFARAK
jgi:phosphate starvation-inducible membrane PsiE